MVMKTSPRRPRAASEKGVSAPKVPALLVWSGSAQKAGYFGLRSKSQRGTCARQAGGGAVPVADPRCPKRFNRLDKPKTDEHYD